MNHRLQLLGPVLVTSLFGCAARPSPSPSTPATTRPPSATPADCRGVRLETQMADLTSALPRQQSLPEALALRRTVLKGVRQGGRGGPRRIWQLVGFDCHWLHFIIGREAPARQAAGPPRKVHVRYEAQRRVVVRRTAHAVAAFGVGEVIAMHEQGVSGVRVGMSAAEVARIAGPALKVAHPAAAGCLQQRHRDVVVYLCNGRVRSVRAVRD